MYKKKYMHDQGRINQGGGMQHKCIIAKLIVTKNS